MKKAYRDYKEWRSYKMPVIQALRMTWKYNVGIYWSDK